MNATEQQSSVTQQSDSDTTKWAVLYMKDSKLHGTRRVSHSQPKLLGLCAPEESTLFDSYDEAVEASAQDAGYCVEQNKAGHFGYYFNVEEYVIVTSAALTRPTLPR